jgi:hypothetical protein
MAFSSNNLDWTVWKPFTETVAYNLPEGDGIQTVYVKVSDRAGNNGSRSDDIILDTEPPHSLSIEIEDGAAETDDINVTLNLSAFDEVSGVVEMRFSTDNSNWTDWETYSENKEFTLSGGEGEKTIFFKVRDYVGNEAEPVSASITLVTDPEKPKPEVKDTDGDGYDDDVDEFPNDPNEWADNDNDNIGDNLDTDDDNDFFYDEWEIFMGTDPNDASDRPLDTDGDGDPDGDPGNTRDWMDKDDDGDGYTDAEELEKGTNPLDKDDYPDEKETDDDAEEAMMYLIILIVIIIIVVVLALAMRGKGKGEEDEESEEDNVGGEEENMVDEDDRPVVPPKGAASMDDEGEFECPTCGTPLSVDAMVCSECGEEFEDE